MSTVLITGAGRGIGLELARQLRQRGMDVIACCRRVTPELEQLDVRVETDVDVASLAAILDLDRRLGDSSIDWLFNVSGVMSRQCLGEIDEAAIADMRLQFEVNALGPLLVTQTLSRRMPKGGKVGIVTSRMGSIADNTSGNSYGYRMSKVAVNMAGVSLARDLHPDGIAVALLHPGYVRTAMTGHQGLIDPPDSAAGLIVRMEELTLESSGGFWHTNGEMLPW